MTRNFALLCLTVNVLGASSILNTPTIDATQFRVTQFASGQALPSSILRASDGSLLALLSPGFSGAQLVRYVDANMDGIADGAPTVLYSNPGAGAMTNLRQADKLYYAGEFGSSSIRALSPGTDPGDAVTSVGALQFSYPDGHLHPSQGIAVRKTPGVEGSVDLVFNVGSQYNNQLSTSPVTISGMGLAATELAGDSLYMITIDETGAIPMASNLRQVATGIRNVYGMAFHPVTGDLYFADNAIDEDPVTNLSEPMMADELNRIPVAALGNTVLRFGYPTCYPQYRTGTMIELTPGGCTDVTQSLINFQPVPNDLSGFRSEGPTEIAFAPAMFPAIYQGGLFVGFSGGTGPDGTNNQNPLVFVNSFYSALAHFIESGTIGNILGVYSTNDSLYLADWGGGSIYQITAINEVPEPGTVGVVGGVLGLLWAWSRKSRQSS
jgi:glucose/arabinose dehydrogenase